MAQIISILSEISDAGLEAWDAKPFLEKVTEIAPSIIYVFNQQTLSNEYSNRSLGNALGYSAEEVQAMGSAFLPKLIHPEDMPRIARHQASLVDLADGEVASIEYRIRHKDGHWAWLLSHETVFERAPDGSVLRHIGVASDISAQKAAEEAALAEQRAANVATEELRAFTYSITHDLKSPATSIGLLLDELQTQHSAELSDDARLLIQLGVSTVERMSDLLDDVAGFANVVGKDVATQEVALERVVASVLDDLAEPIARTGAQITCAPLPTVFGDPAQLRLVLKALIVNALTYQPPAQTPEVEISDVSAEGAETWAIAVSDNGLGIARENQSRIFQMFGRLHTKDEYPGSGLGLTLARRIAIAHDGDIDVRSEPGRGSIFTLTLPRT